MTGMKRIHSFDEVFDTQRVFRLILTAMANPARIVDISPFAAKLYGDEPEMLAAAMTLLDNEVSFHVCGEHGAVGGGFSDGGRGLPGHGGFSEDIQSLTLANRKGLRMPTISS